MALGTIQPDITDRSVAMSSPARMVDHRVPGIGCICMARNANFIGRPGGAVIIGVGTALCSENYRTGGLVDVQSIGIAGCTYCSGQPDIFAYIIEVAAALVQSMRVVALNALQFKGPFRSRVGITCRHPVHIGMRGDNHRIIIVTAQAHVIWTERSVDQVGCLLNRGM